MAAMDARARQTIADLLATLQAIESTILWHWRNEGDFVGDMMDALPDIRAAIAKARGEEGKTK
jgi:hypothetical protein